MAVINTQDRPPAEVLMEALAEVEGAQQVCILIEKKDCVVIKTNATHKDLKWLFDQGSFAVMKDLFEPEEK